MQTKYYVGSLIDSKLKIKNNQVPNPLFIYDWET